MKPFLIIVFCSVIFQSCCLNCNCDDDLEEAIPFQFSTDYKKGFEIKDIDTIFIIQYKKNTFIKTDSICLIADSASGIYHCNIDTKRTLLLSFQFGFSLTQYGFFNDINNSDYMITTQNLKKFLISHICVEGVMVKKDPFCSYKCYFNTKKMFMVNNINIDISGKNLKNSFVTLYNYNY